MPDQATTKPRHLPALGVINNGMPALMDRLFERLAESPEDRADCGCFSEPDHNPEIACRRCGKTTCSHCYAAAALRCAHCGLEHESGADGEGGAS